MTSTILVPLDGSSAGEDALPYAVALARAAGDSIHLLTVITGYGFRHPAIAWEWLKAPTRRARELHLQTVADRLVAEGVDVTTELTDGEPVATILQVAHTRHAGLIALATHGWGGVDRLLLGSVTDKVMRLSPVPVMITRRQHPEGVHAPIHVRRVAVPLDGSPAAEAAIAAAADLLAAGSLLFLVQVLPPLEGDVDGALLLDLKASNQHLAESAASYLLGACRRVTVQVQVETRVLHGAVVAELQRFVEDEGIDLVVMTTHGLGGWQRLLVGSIADRLVRSGVPSLLIPAAAAEAAEPAR